MNILLVDNGTTLLHKLERAIPHEVVVKTWNHLKGIVWKDFDAVILSGGSLFEVVEGKDRLQDEIRMIHDTQKLLIGICFGCELIAETFGARLEKDSVDHVGVIDIEIASDGEIFDGQRRFSVCEHHRWLVKDLPKEFHILATSQHGIEMFRHASRPIYGLQFHPEQFEHAQDGEKIFLNILKKEIGI